EEHGVEVLEVLGRDHLARVLRADELEVAGLLADLGEGLLDEARLAVLAAARHVVDEALRLGDDEEAFLRRLLVGGHHDGAEEGQQAGGDEEAKVHGNSLMRMWRNSNLPSSACRPMPPLAGMLVMTSSGSPLIVQSATLA